MGVFPSLLANESSVSMVSWLVPSPRITSTNAICCGGLKKCIPAILSGRWVTLLICVTLRVEVLDTKIACEGATESRVANTLHFKSKFSGTASIAKSKSLPAFSQLVVRLIRLRVASEYSLLIFFFSTNLLRLHLIFSLLCPRWPSFKPTIITSYPAKAKIWATPWPIVPEPITAVLLSFSKPVMVFPQNQETD